MQVGTEENVRVTQVNSIGRMPVSQQNAAGLQNGDFLAATVAQVEGDKLMLRLEDGSLLRASQQGQMRFTQGDMLEAAVSKNGTTCFLYILNVSRPGAQSAPGGAAALASQQTVSEMLSVMKRNPGLDADIALFLAENHIPDTAENIAALTQMSRGTGIGTLLGKMLGLIAQPQETAQSVGLPAVDISPMGDAALPQQGQAPVEIPHAGQGGSSVQPTEIAQAPDPAAGNIAPQHGAEEMVQAPAPGLLGSMSDAKTPGPGPQTQGMPGQDSAVQSTAVQAAPPQGAPQHAPSAALYGTENTDAQHTGQTTLAQGPVPQQAQHTGVATRSVFSAPEDMAANAGGAAVDTGAPANTDTFIGNMIRGLFFQPQGQTGAEMKKNAAEMPRALKTLKSELVQTDMKNKELYLKSADQVLRQMEMADKATRFEHMQLPFSVKDGEYRTAELYVFRRQSGRKRATEAGLSILVALDTEHIGRVETLICEAGGDISLEFRLQEPGMAEVFKHSSVLLAQAVEAAGYRLTGMRFAALEKRTTVLNAADTVSLDAGERPPGIDVQI